MYAVELEQEDDGRWIAEVHELPGVIVYGQSREEAIRKAQALSQRVLAERSEHGEPSLDGRAGFSVGKAAPRCYDSRRHADRRR